MNEKQAHTLRAAYPSLAAQWWAEANKKTVSPYEKRVICQAGRCCPDLTQSIMSSPEFTDDEKLSSAGYFQNTLTELLEKPYYVIKNNDILIVEPNFSKVKSAGFIGSPSSIASISSLLLSITLLIINN